MGKVSERGILEKYPIKRYDAEKLYARRERVKEAPDYLYYRGDISLLDSDVVAVIGSREVSDRGRTAARNISRALCRRGKTLLNGLALGCDAEALREAIDCGGRGIAVLPCGLDQIYPKANIGLAEELLEKGGCLVSEYPAGIHPRKESFVARDRLQALFSKMVIVVESHAGGGTWHTVEYARKYQKLVACYIDKNEMPDSGNEILVKKNKAYALRNNEGIDFLLELSQGRFEQMELFLEGNGR